MSPQSNGTGPPASPTHRPAMLNGTPTSPVAASSSMPTLQALECRLNAQEVRLSRLEERQAEQLRWLLELQQLQAELSSLVVFQNDHELGTRYKKAELQFRDMFNNLVQYALQFPASSSTASVTVVKSQPSTQAAAAVGSTSGTSARQGEEMRRSLFPSAAGVGGARGDNLLPTPESSAERESDDLTLGTSFMGGVVGADEGWGAVQGWGETPPVRGRVAEKGKERQTERNKSSERRKSGEKGGAPRTNGKGKGKNGRNGNGKRSRAEVDEEEEEEEEVEDRFASSRTRAAKRTRREEAERDSDDESTEPSEGEEEAGEEGEETEGSGEEEDGEHSEDDEDEEDGEDRTQETASERAKRRSKHYARIYTRRKKGQYSSRGMAKTWWVKGRGGRFVDQRKKGKVRFTKLPLRQRRGRSAGGVEQEGEGGDGEEGEEGEGDGEDNEQEGETEGEGEEQDWERFPRRSGRKRSDVSYVYPNPMAAERPDPRPESTNASSRSPSLRLRPASTTPTNSATPQTPVILNEEGNRLSTDELRTLYRKTVVDFLVNDPPRDFNGRVLWQAFAIKHEKTMGRSRKQWQDLYYSNKEWFDEEVGKARRAKGLRD